MIRYNIYHKTRQSPLKARNTTVANTTLSGNPYVYNSIMERISITNIQYYGFSLAYN